MTSSSTAAQVRDATRAILDDVILTLTLTPTALPAVTSAVLNASGVRIDKGRVSLDWACALVPDGRCAEALNEWTEITDLEAARVLADITTGQQQDLKAIEAERASATRSGLRLFGGRERRDSLIDAAHDVLAALRALPLRAADFPTVFTDLAAVAGLIVDDGEWQLTDSVGRLVHVSLADLGTSVDDLARATTARAAEIERDRDLIAAFVHDEIHEDGNGSIETRLCRPRDAARLPRLLSDPMRHQPMPRLPWTRPESEPLLLLWQMHLALNRQKQIVQQAEIAAMEAAQRAEDRYQHNLDRRFDNERRQRVEHELRQRSNWVALARDEGREQEDDQLSPH
ncbi:hypothetical protein V3G71_00040 [Microbacterium paraoxydans]|uniref:hypothetical protein n=1 Tax=Microbacterium paraoxydans TaxID=199592 RepID=UPI002F262B6B